MKLHSAAYVSFCLVLVTCRQHSHLVATSGLTTASKRLLVTRTLRSALRKQLFWLNNIPHNHTSLSAAVLQTAAGKFPDQGVPGTAEACHNTNREACNAFDERHSAEQSMLAGTPHWAQQDCRSLKWIPAPCKSQTSSPTKCWPACMPACSQRWHLDTALTASRTLSVWHWLSGTSQSQLWTGHDRLQSCAFPPARH